MNSKEALKIIETYNYYNGAEEYMGNKCIHPDYLKAKPLYDKAINKIERDLDRLNKITKILTDLIQYDKDGWLDEENIGPYLIKIEEWLENE